MGLLILISGLFFYSFFVLICVENTALSLVAFVVNLLFGVLLLFFAGVEFLSFAFLLVYLGAISVLFIFALLFLKLDAKKVPLVFSFDSFTLLFLIFCKCIFFSFAINSNLEMFLMSNSDFTPLSLLNCLKYRWNDLTILVGLFSFFNGYIVLIGLILLVTMIGSIALCILN